MKTKRISSHCLLPRFTIAEPSCPPRVTITAPSFLPRVTISPSSLLRSFFLCFFLLEACYQIGFLSLITILAACFSLKKSSRFNLYWSQKRKQTIFFIGEPDPQIIIKKPKSIVKKEPRKTNLTIGAEVISSGTAYFGEFLNGQKNGSGVFKVPKTCLYEGNFADGLYDGFGVQKLLGIGEFKGSFSKGLKHGFGSYRYENGDRYEGEYRYGLKCGTGEHVFSDGSSYVGEFRRGLRHGLGIYRFRNGDIYMGEYFGDRFLGFGVYEFANGDMYQGSWHEGKMQGFGVYTTRNREMKSGIWDSGFLVTSLPPRHPCVQKSLEATRKVFERCMNMPRVEDNVYKAILAAKDAAKYARLVSDKAFEKINRKFIVNCIMEMIEIYNLIRTSYPSFHIAYKDLRKRVIKATRVKAKRLAKSPAVHKAFLVVKKTRLGKIIGLYIKELVEQFIRTTPPKDEYLHFL